MGTQKIERAQHQIQQIKSTGCTEEVIVRQKKVKGRSRSEKVKILTRMTPNEQRKEEEKYAWQTEIYLLMRDIQSNILKDRKILEWIEDAKLGASFRTNTYVKKEFLTTELDKDTSASEKDDQQHKIVDTRFGEKFLTSRQLKEMQTKTRSPRRTPRRAPRNASRRPSPPPSSNRRSARAPPTTTKRVRLGPPGIEGEGG